MDRDRDPQSTSSFGGPSNGFYHPSSSSAASSMRCSTPSSWRSDGKMSTSTEKFLPVTLMYSYKNGNKVLFLEAGKDFVDILLSFLSLPMGAIVRLLYSSSGGGGDSTTTGLQLQRQLGPDHEEAIFKLFNSVEKMEDKKFCTSKKSLVDPPEASGFGSKLLRLLHLDPAEQQEPCSSSSALATSYYHCNPVYYSCGMVPHCVCITKKLGRRCPRHGRKMQAPCTFVEGTRNNNNNISASNHHSKPVETGYVKDVGKFFITDGLGIYAGSKSLALLHKLKIERMSLLSSVDLFIGMDEILRLLKASLVSPNVLQEVFGRLVQTRLPTPLAPPPSIVSTTTNTPPAPPPSIVSTATTATSPPTLTIVATNTDSAPPIPTVLSNTSKGFNNVVAFAYDRNRPKYDDYFPRPNCKSLMFW